MPENKLSLKEIFALIFFSVAWLFPGYWIINVLIEFHEPWVPVVFLLLPYLIIVSRVWGIAIKAGTSGVEVSPIAKRVSDVSTLDALPETVARKLRSEISTEKEELIQILTKSAFERLSDEDLRKIKGIVKYIAVYPYSPISRVLTISEAMNYKYFPVIESDRTMELQGVVTYSQVLDYTRKNEGWEKKNIGNLLAMKKPTLRAYINETTKEVKKKMLKNNLTKLPVVDARNRLKGIITLKDLS